MNKLSSPGVKLKPGRLAGKTGLPYMSIPHSKRQGIADFIRNHGPESVRRIPPHSPASPGDRDSPVAAKPSQGSPVAAKPSQGSPVAAKQAVAALMIVVGVLGGAMMAMDAKAEVIASLNGTAVGPITTIQTNTADFTMSPTTGKLLVIWTDEIVGDDNCWMSLSNDLGATWFRTKMVGLNTNTQCYADWIDDDSFVIAGGSNPGATTFKLTHNDGLTFTTFACGAPCPSGQVSDIQAATDLIWAVGITAGTSRIVYTYNGGTSFTQGTTAISNAKGIEYNGVAGSWNWGSPNPPAGNSFICSTVDDFTATSCTATWDPTDEGVGDLYVPGNMFGRFTATNSAFSPARDFGVDQGSAPMQLYANAGSTRTIQTLAGEIIHNDAYWAIKQTGDTITPRHIIGIETNYRQIEDLDASATATVKGINGADGTLYIVYLDGVGAATRARLITAADFINNANRIQIPVNDLTQGDADSTGTVVIVRTDLGQTVETYNLGTGQNTGLVSTTNCGPVAQDVGFGGVSIIRSGNGNFYSSYGDCTVPGLTDTLWVRSGTLGAPTFPAQCNANENDGECRQENNEFSLGRSYEFNVPNNLGDLGSISLFPYSFQNSDFNGLDNGYATWTFSTLEGQLGVLSVAYNDAAIDKGDRAFLDVSPGQELSSFCTWTSSGIDYMIGGDGNAPTTVATAGANIDRPAASNSNQVDVFINLLYTNSGTYGDALGISCAQNRAVINTVQGFVYVIDVPTGAIIAGPFPTDTVVENGVAISGDTLFFAYVNGASIDFAYTSNATVVGSVSRPTGDWVGMELDGPGGKAIMFTSDFITVDTVSNFTCKLNCTNNLDDFGETFANGTGNGNGNGGAGSGSGDVSELLGNPYFWVLFWVLLINVIIAAISWGTRAGFGGTVYGVATMITYIFGILLNGPTEVSPWPIVAVLVFVIGLGISRWWSR